MSNHLPTEKKISVLHHLVEGNTIRSTARLTGVSRDTISRLMLKFGAACQRFLDRELRGLVIHHAECDEIWTFVQKKQTRLTTTEREERGDIGDMYLWTAIDQDTKLLAAHVVGKRSADMARRLMVQLASRVNLPGPGAVDASGGYRPVIQISVDGFAAYPEAVDLAFGPYAKLGSIIKNYRNALMDYSPSEMVGTGRRGIFRMAAAEEGSICTSHVERHNLTIRTLMKRFTRLSLGFSKKLENLEAAVAIFMVYYNWVWRTDGAPGGGLRPPAAMLAKICSRLWKFPDMYEAVVAA